MKKRLCALLALILLFACVACGDGAASASASVSTSEKPPVNVTEGMERYVVKKISYEIPEDWDTDEAVQGYHHIAPDGGIFYVNTADFPYHNLRNEEEANEAIDETLLYVEATMPDFRIIKEKPRRFLGCHGREVWFQIKLPDGQKAALFSLLFADRKLVYNLMFTVSSNDVEAAMPAILQSVALG